MQNRVRYGRRAVSELRDQATLESSPVRRDGLRRWYALWHRLPVRQRRAVLFSTLVGFCVTALATRLVDRLDARAAHAAFAEQAGDY